MPYISHADQIDLECGKVLETPGELNYLITMMLQDYLNVKGKTYTAMNDVVGVLESAKLEFYRRVVVPYEKDKMLENGDVYYV